MELAKKNIILYQLITLAVFLIGITITKKMDLTLPAYILLSALPYLRSLRYFDSKFVLLYFFFCAVYLLIGIAVQDVRSSLVAFCSRLYQFMALMWFFGNRMLPKIRINIRKVLLIAAGAESVIGFCLLLSNGSNPGSGMVRLVAGSQPVSGNFAIVVIPLMIWSYFHEPENRKWIIRSGYILLMWIILSGTRGYLLLYGMALIIVYIDYWFSNRQNAKTLRNKITLFLAVIFAFTIVLLNTEGVMETVSGVFRLNEGTGVRKSENQVALQTFWDTSWEYKLFGMGLGGIAREIPGFETAVTEIMTERWNYDQHIDSIGVAFHNLFANTLLMQGLLGCVVLGGVFIWGWRKISGCRMVCYRERLCFYLYWVGFFLMNCYRWSCDCGIAEMIILGLVLSKLTQDSGLQETSHRKEG